MIDNINLFVDKAKEASIEVKRLHDDTDFLCETLNSLDVKKLREFYTSDKVGPVIEIRKSVAKEILLGGIKSDNLVSIIQECKGKNPKQLGAWKNPYKILHSLINYKYSDLDEFVKDLIPKIKERIGFDVNSHYVNFDGPNYMGSDFSWIAFYEIGKEKSTNPQIFIQWKDGQLTYGVYIHSENRYEVGPIQWINEDDFWKFIDDCKSFLTIGESDTKVKIELFGAESVNSVVNLDGDKDDNWTFVTAAKEVLKRCDNNPMSSNDIWKKIVEYGFNLNSSGKTPWDTLNTKLLKYSHNSNIKLKSKNSIFEVVGSNPMKFKLAKHIPVKVKDCFLDDGFIHISNLKEALESLGFEINTKK